MKDEEQKEKFLIFGFLRKILNKEESEDFKTNIKDGAFEDELANEVIHQYGRDQLKSKLDHIHTEVDEDRRKEDKNKKLSIVVLVLFLSAFLWFVVFNNDSSPRHESDEIFASYFEPYPSLFEQKGNTESDEQKFSAAMKAYNDQDFAKAVLLLDSYLSERNVKNSLASFYYGIALLADGQNQKALAELLKLNENSNANNVLPQEPYRWYLALAYLGNNQSNEALPLLEILSVQKRNGFMQKEATEILKKMR